MPTVYIGIGSNLGDRKANITRALQRLGAVGGLIVDKVSSLSESTPRGAWGPDFINAVARITTELGPRELLGQLQAIEKELKREGSFKNAPRTIDLDILLYGQEVIDEPDLTIPHPRMLERDFVLQPLLEIEPGFTECLESLKKQKARS
jgi:2-amino-4-hydroxy-6-hydroxymethyldihydropteridine diphosphokinase